MRRTPHLLAALFLSFASCGGSDTPPPDEGPTEPDPNHCKASDFTCVRVANSLYVRDVGLPFDPNVQDQKSGPDDWATQYGTAPQYFAHVNADGSIDLVWNDWSMMAPTDKRRAFHFHLRPGASGWETTSSFHLASAGRVLGFSKDEKNSRFYFVTSIEEDLSVKMSPTKLHRPNIVKMIEYGRDVRIRKTWDLGQLRGKQYPDSLPLYSPMNFSTSRVLFGGGKVAMIFGVNTEVDMAIMRRHQMARYMELDVATDHIDREAGIWCSHSFEQRLAFDGGAFVEAHLGDAYPRAVELARHVIGSEPGKATMAVNIKGKEGDNNTFSRLGGMVRLTDGVYLVAFVTESTDGTTIEGGLERVAGPRNLGLARVDLDTARMDDGFGSEYPVTITDGAGKARNVVNSVVWLTTGTETTTQIERPRIARIADNRNLVLYETWTRNGDSYAFSSVRSVLVDDNGKVVMRNAALKHQNIRLPRSDDLYVLGGKAAWFSGNAGTKEIFLHTLDSKLVLESASIK